MAMLDAEITDDDYTTLIHILEEWESFGSAETSTHRKETSTRLKAKLFLQRNDAHVNQMFMNDRVARDG